MSERTPHRVHFIGIGGIGMSGIAEVLLQSGYEVTGSDLRENAQTRRLQELGARIAKGHQASNVGEAEVVVISSAVPKDNPEIVRAKKDGVQILARAEMLAELMRKKKSIVVSGAHGKTTNSAMIAALLTDAGIDPTAIIGGRLQKTGSTVRVGRADWFVAESDESDGSFLHLMPTIAVITNLDREHLDHYGSYEKLEDAFVDFANRVPFDGFVVACLDDPHLAAILPRVKRPVFAYGIEHQAEVMASDVRLSPNGARFNLQHNGKQVCEVALPATGRHNVLNALGAAAVGLLLDLSGTQIARGLAAYPGTERRLEWKGEAAGVRVIDDYAHHPTEIRATLESLRLMVEKGAVRVLFQPHRYSRLAQLWNDFLEVFDAADELVVLPIYAASEKPIPRVESRRFVAECKSRGRTDAEFADTLENGARMLVEHARAGDVLAGMGAGDITSATTRMVELLTQRSDLEVRA